MAGRHLVLRLERRHLGGHRTQAHLEGFARALRGGHDHLRLGEVALERRRERVGGVQRAQVVGRELRQPVLVGERGGAGGIACLLERLLVHRLELRELAAVLRLRARRRLARRLEVASYLVQLRHLGLELVGDGLREAASLEHLGLGRAQHRARLLALRRALRERRGKRLLVPRVLLAALPPRLLQLCFDRLHSLAQDRRLLPRARDDGDRLRLRRRRLSDCRLVAREHHLPQLVVARQHAALVLVGGECLRTRRAQLRRARLGLGTRPLAFGLVIGVALGELTLEAPPLDLQRGHLLA